MWDRLRTVRLGPEQLRRAARVLRRFGLRIEFDPVRHPPSPRRGKHVGLVRQLRIGLTPGLPLGRVVVEGVSVAMPGKVEPHRRDEPGPRDRPSYRTPDLSVCPSGFLRAEDRLLHPQHVDAVVEVVEGAVTEQQIAGMAAWYGMAGVPALLVVDPRTAPGRWTLYAEPVTGSYWLTRHGTFGDPVRLRWPCPDLPTSELALYGGESDSVHRTPPGTGGSG